MGIYRKALRYGLKKQAEASQGSLARTADRLRILSSVLAAGFVVLPFFVVYKNPAIVAGLKRA